MAIVIRDEIGMVRHVTYEFADLVRWRWISPSGSLMLPGHPDFNLVKDQSAPLDLFNKIKEGKASQILIQKVGSGINEMATAKEVDEYFNGGEWEERQKELGEEPLAA